MKIRLLIPTVLALIAFIGCQQSAKKASWSGQMQNMSKDIQRLIPYIYDKPAFEAPENKTRITTALNDLAHQSHKIPEEMGKKFLGDDPIVGFSLSHLKSDLSRAAYAFSVGQTDYSRSVLKSSIGHCFRCHSLTTMGSEARWDASEFNHLELTAEEKLDLLVAARKYKEAFQFGEEKLSQPELIQKNPLVFENLLRKYLALSLRLNEKPQAALKDLDRVLAHKELPVYMAKQVKAWRDSLSGWDKNKSKGDFIDQAQKRITQAKRLQEYAYDHAGDVDYIWATDILHEGLRKPRRAKDEAKAYFLLGLSYEVLDDLGSYGLHEAYFEACVKKDPHTQLARRCFDRLEASLVQGFSGSSGLSLPSDEKQRLKTLKELL